MVLNADGMAGTTKIKSPKLKRKSTDSTQASSPQKKQNLTSFTELEFKMMLRDSATTFIALEKFIAESSRWPEDTENDIVSDYCRSSPECTEIVRLLEQRDRKPRELALIMESLEKILLRIADDLQKYEVIGMNVVRQLLATHLSSVYSLLAMRNKSGHIKIALKLLVAMVMQGETAAREVQLQFDFQHSVLPPLLTRRDRKDIQDVRMCYLQFMMSFLMVGDTTTVRQIVETKGFLNGIFPNIGTDKFTTLQLVLPTLTEKIVQNPTIPKTAKIRLFNESALKHLAELYGWKGSSDIQCDVRGKQKIETERAREDDVDTLVLEQQQEVQTMVHHLLLELCCSLKVGINFWDKSCATSGKNQNQVLTRLLTNLQKPHLHRLQGELVCQILKVCPDQIHWYLPSLKNSLAPRPSSTWIKCMDFIHQIYSRQDDVSVTMATQQPLTLQKMVNIITNALLPPKDVWSTIVSAIKKENLLVRYYGVKLCLVIIKRLVSVLHDCDKSVHVLPDGFLTVLRDNMIKLLPNLDAVYNCWLAAIKTKDDGVKSDTDEELPAVSLPDHLQMLLQVLCCYQDAFPQLFTEHHIDYSTLLEGLRVARQFVEQQQMANDKVSMLQLYLVKLLVGSEGRQFNWTKENVEGHTALFLLLEMVVSTRKDTKISRVVKQLIIKLFLRTGYFKSAESEVSWWINTLVSFHNPRPVIGCLDKAVSQLMRTPYVFLDKIQEALATALSMNTDGSTAGMIRTNAGSPEELLKSILSVGEIDLISEEEEMDIEIDDISRKAVTRPTTSQSFSPLVPAVLHTLEKFKSDETDVIQYLQQILSVILHHQSDPAPLCILLTSHPCYDKLIQLHASVNRWNPAVRGKKKQKKSPKKASKQLSDDRQTQWLMLSEMLQNAFECGNELVLRHEITEKTKQLFMSEAPDIIKQLLLYLRTAVMEYIQNVTMTTDLVKFYAELVCVAIETVSKSEEASATCVPDTNESSQDFPILHIEETSKIDVVQEIFIFFLCHDTIIKYFVNEVGASDKARNVSRVISPLVGRAVLMIPDTLDLSSNLTPFLCKISSYLDTHHDLTTEFLETANGFAEWIDSETFEKLSLALLGSDHLLNFVERDQASDTVSHEHMLDILKEFGSKRRLQKHSLQLDVMSKLTALAVNKGNERLLCLVSDVFEAAPVYGLALKQDVFQQLLEQRSAASDKLLSLVLAGNPYCRHWLKDWVVRTQHRKKKYTRWHVANYVLYYLQGATDYSDVTFVYKMYWPELCQWLLGDDSELTAEDVKFRMLCRMIKLSLDIDDLISLAENLTSCTPAAVINITKTKQKMVTLKLLLQKIFSLQSSHHSKDSPKHRDTSFIVQKSVHFGISTFVQLMADKMTRDPDVIKLTLSNVMTWTKKLEADLDLGTDDTWNTFITLGLRNLYTDPEYLSLLGQLLPRVYNNSNHDNQSASSGKINVKDVHKMVLAHSQFLATMLSEGKSLQKDSLVDLLVVLTDLDPACCQTSHIAVLLGAYGATLNITDQKLLLLLHKYEENGCDLASYRPYMWGPQAIEHHNLKKSLGPSLCKSPTMEQVIGILDKDKLAASALKFPLLRKMQVDIQDDTDLRSDLDIYDPCFLLPLFGHLLATENLVNCKKFAEQNCLSYVLSALSCHDETLRALAYHTLARYHVHLEGRTKFNNRYQILYMLNTVKNSVENPNTKLPCVVTTFLARAAQLILRPEDYMYQIVNAFLLLKPAMDIRRVPEFYMLFNSTAPEHKTERSWMLSLLRDGLRETQDYHVFERNKVFRLVLSFYESAMSDHYTQLQVLMLLEVACNIRSVTSGLVKNHGLLQWLGIAVHNGARDATKACHLVNIIHAMWTVHLGDRDSEGGSTCQSPESLNSTVDEPEAVSLNCLPVAFTNQMSLILLDLVNQLSNPSLETFNKFLECLLSVCKHAEKTQRLFGARRINNVISTHLTQRHVLILLNHWATLSKDTHLLSETEKLLKKQQLSREGRTEAAKREPNKQSRIDNEHDTEKVQCWDKLLQLVPLCKRRLENHSSVSDRSELDVRTIMDILFLLDWSLGELGCLGATKISLVESIVSWFWSLLEDSTQLQDTLLDSESGVRHFLALYNYVLYAPEEDPGAEVDLRKSDLESLLCKLNQIFFKLFLRLISNPKQSQKENNTKLKQRLNRTIFRDVTEKISRLPLDDPRNNQTQVIAMSFVLETMLGAALPTRTKHLLDST